MARHEALELRRRLRAVLPRPAALAAHPSTPLGRDRGVVVGMLDLLPARPAWICTFYVLSGDQLPKVPVFNDLNQFNLVVGIGFMAVGFSYATRWE